MTPKACSRPATRSSHDRPGGGGPRVAASPAGKVRAKGAVEEDLG
jgi:hypothetical protein